MKARAYLQRSSGMLILFSLFINVFLLLPPIYLLQVYDRVLPAASLTTLLYLSLIAIAALTFLALMEIVRTIYCQRVSLQFEEMLRKNAFLAAMAPQRFADRDRRVLQDLSTVRGFVASKALHHLVDLPFTPLFMILLFLVHPVLFYVTFGGAALLILLVLISEAATKRAVRAANECSTAATQQAQAFISRSDTVRSMAMIGRVTDIWANSDRLSAVLKDRSATLIAAFSGVSRSLRIGLQLAILCAGAMLVLAEEMTAGMIFAASIVSGRALQPIDQLVVSWRRASEAASAWKGLETAVAELPAPDEKVLLTPPKGAVTANALSWAPQGYPTDEFVLKDLNFSVHSGEIVGIIGTNGSGKSTLAALLAGSLEPTSGKLLLDGTDYKNWDQKQLANAVGYMPQEIQFIPGTVAQNISRFDESPDSTTITAAVTRAEADTVISGLPEGYQTQLVSPGSRLSGGAKQRIALARAFYKDPQILVLDEPNANLDSEGEKALDVAIAAAQDAGRTIFIISHRLSILKRCTRVLALANGSLEYDGPLDTLGQQVSLSKPTTSFPVKAEQAERKVSPPVRRPSLETA